MVLKADTRRSPGGDESNALVGGSGRAAGVVPRRCTSGCVRRRGSAAKKPKQQRRKRNRDMAPRGTGMGFEPQIACWKIGFILILHMFFCFRLYTPDVSVNTAEMARVNS